MKKLILNFMVFASISFASAQVPNPGFENWTNDEPNGWWSFDQLAPVGGCVQETDAHTGSFAAKIQTASFNGGVTVGYLALTNISDQTTERGIPYTLRPTDFSFWTKFSTAGSDSVIVVAQLSKWNGTSSDVVGEAGEVLTGSQTTYTQYTPTFTYTSNDTPDSLQILILVGQPGNGFGTLNSFFILDDIEIDGSVTPGVTNAPSNLVVTPLKTSANNGIRLIWADNSNDETGFVFERSTTVNGPFSQIGTIGPDATIYDDLTTVDGTTYFYKVFAENANGRSSSSNVANATASGTVGIENQLAALVNIFPNPSSGTFSVSLPNELLGASVKVYNILGENVYSTVAETQLLINLDVAKGNYFLKVQHEKNTINKRISIN